jgi:hypothetical protein
MAPDRMAGEEPATPIRTQTLDDGQAIWVRDDMELGSVSNVRVDALAVPTYITNGAALVVPSMRQRGDVRQVSPVRPVTVVPVGKESYPTDSADADMVVVAVPATTIGLAVKAEPILPVPVMTQETVVEHASEESDESV